MKERGLIFSGAMVRALLQRRKRVTRRLDERLLAVKKGDRFYVRETFALYCITDRSPGGLWGEPSASVGMNYRADHKTGNLTDGDGGYNFYTVEGAVNVAKAEEILARHYHEWRPSIFMPRWASRITLEATEDARLEPLARITEDEALSEGIWPEWHPGTPAGNVYYFGERGKQSFGGGFDTAVQCFECLWNSLHLPKHPFASNPNVVRLAFDIVDSANAGKPKPEPTAEKSANA